MTTSEKAVFLHKEWNGKIETTSKSPVKNREDLSIAYTPGVAEPCKLIAEHPEDAYVYTMKANTVAVVSDGSAVLGLGNIGPYAAMPVMEGKCVLFKEFGGINAVPICLPHGQRAHRAPGVGDDAVGAEVGAAVLHLQKGPGPALQPPGGEPFKMPPLKGRVHGLQGGLALPLPDGLFQKA